MALPANPRVEPYARIQAEVQHPRGVNSPHTAAHVHNTSFLTHADQLPPDMSFLCRRNMTPIVLGPQWQATVHPECASQIWAKRPSSSKILPAGGQRSPPPPYPPVPRQSTDPGHTAPLLSPGFRDIFSLLPSSHSGPQYRASAGADWPPAPRRRSICRPFCLLGLHDHLGISAREKSGMTQGQLVNALLYAGADQG